MDDSVTLPQRVKAPANREPPPQGWHEVQDRLAEDSGLSILLVSGPQPPELANSNNNSICEAFQSSPDHKPLCDPYCGEAYERAVTAGRVAHYRCHAGLHCMTAPVNLDGRSLAVIAGRAFLTTADYRALAERIRVGDLQELLSDELFRNVIFASRSDLENLAARVSRAASELSLGESGQSPAESSEVARQDTVTGEGSKGLQAAAEPVFRGEAGASADMAPARDSGFREICAEALDHLGAKFGASSAALFLREHETLVPIFVTGRLQEARLSVGMAADDPALAAAAHEFTSVRLHQTAEGNWVAPSVDEDHRRGPSDIAELFPLLVNDEVKGALLCGGPLSATKRRAIGTYCREMALPFEVRRLRSELERRVRISGYLQSFTERISAVDPAETYHSILRHSTELLGAERGSLLLFDEAANELSVKAAVGLSQRVMDEARIRLGDGVSGEVLRDGRPLVVRDLDSAGRKPSASERPYKTKSFISYPITVGDRKIGVLNVTDKSGGGTYDEIDLSILDLMAPQMALAMDRAEWHEKAAQFQLMSITDPLTGLLNRRYLEERLSEELNRSKRQNYPMSFMMIDIDDFKPYNDRNGHQAGDLALEMTAQCLKSALRAADVASRYGGEEFCILLPQTSLGEAHSIAERIRRRVERTRFPHGKTQPLGAVTISIGVAAYCPLLDTPQKLIGAADQALYLAKRDGKNRVVAKETVQPHPPVIDVSEQTK